MKNVKKLLSIIMVLTLVLSLGASALAATVEIGEAKDGAVHSYEAYQVFTGTSQAADGAIGNLTWGSGIKPADFVKALKADATIGAKFTSIAVPEDGSAPDAQAVAEVLSGLTDAEAKTVAKIAYANRNGDGYELPAGEKEDLPIGYYVIVDTTNVDGENLVKNEVILQLTDDIEITFKTDIPSSEKKVKDINDSEDSDVSDNDWQKSADWDIGDDVPFQLTATIPENTTTTYDTYELTFHDKEGDGLAFNSSSVKVYLNGVEITDTSKYSVNSNPGDGDTFDVTIPNVKALVGFDAAAKNVITVEYTSKLDTDAVIGPDGNPNTMHIEFSNDSTSETTGKTPDDTVIVFTYKMDVNKVDDSIPAKPLAGAGFTLYKEVSAPTDDDPDAVEWEKIGEEVMVSGSEATGFVASFKGLDDGNYKLVESTTPDGYNTIPDVTFTVKAEHEETDKLTNLEVTDIDPEDFDITADLSGGSLSTTITNQKGVELPETGGIGTTIFYIAGAVLVAGAVILLVTKKRVSGTEK